MDEIRVLRAQEIVVTLERQHSGSQHSSQENFRPTSRNHSQRDKILALLRERGPVGATNRDLNEIGFRYGARLWELKHEGFSIETRPMGDGLFKFILLAEPNSSEPTLSPYLQRIRDDERKALPLFAEVVA